MLQPRSTGLGYEVDIESPALNIGNYGTILGIMALYWELWYYIGKYGTILGNMVLYWELWYYMMLRNNKSTTFPTAHEA